MKIQRWEEKKGKAPREWESAILIDTETGALCASRAGAAAISGEYVSRRPALLAFSSPDCARRCAIGDRSRAGTISPRKCQREKASRGEARLRASWAVCDTQV